MKKQITGSKWEKTRVTNLLRNVSSGGYYARVRVGGKLIWRSLDTLSFNIARIKLPDVEREERARLESTGKLLERDATFGDALTIFEKNLDGDPRLKAGGRAYRRRCIAALLRSWPDLKQTRLAKITVDNCSNWAKRFANAYSSTVYNNTLGTLAMVIEIGIRAGVRYRNPAKEIKRAKVSLRQLHLPAQQQFQKFIESIASRGGRFSHPCADLVRFLAFGGFRKEEASNVAWADCDFDKGQIRVRVTKNGEIRHVPMIPEMRTLLERLRVEQPEAQPADAIMQVRECQKAMDRAATEAGMNRITHHDLRHLFATRCIESGVDIPTVSRWLGHKDGGGLAMRVYGHLRDQHSTEMAQKVKFS